MRISSRLSILTINLVLRFISFEGAGIKIGVGSWIKCKAAIGTGTGIGWGFCVRGAGELTIGKHCAIGENVRVITSNHDMNRMAISYILQNKLLNTHFESPKKDVVIGNDVWIGDQAIILPGVSIGNGAVIGAGSVVTKSVAAYSISAGNPARTIRMRFDDKISEKIEQMAWWEWPIKKMLANKNLFINPPQDT